MQRPDMPGRPGLNPLRHSTVYEVTPAQLAVVVEMAEELGLERMRQKIVQLGFAFPPNDPALVPFEKLQFRAAEKAALRTQGQARRRGRIARWVREARDLSDLVLVSVHAHEYGEDEESPAEFLPVFARRMIDEGAGLVVGHGPHLLRGMEIYKRCPIFYSLGNFVGQNELVPRLPADFDEHFRAEPQMTPGHGLQAPQRWRPQGLSGGSPLLGDGRADLRICGREAVQRRDPSGDAGPRAGAASARPPSPCRRQ